MTSSGTYGYSLANGEAVLAAFDRIGIAPPELRQRHMFTARREANLLFVEWSNRQLNLWKVELGTLTLDGSTTFTLPARVVMLLDVYLVTNSGLSSQTDRIITPISRSDYASYPNKSTSGPPTVFWFERLATPTVTFYPVATAASNYVVNYYFVSQIQDAGVPGGETPDIPLRFYDAFVAGLSYRLARTFAPQFEQQRKADYTESWQLAAANDTEKAPVRLRPNFRRYFR